MKTTATHLNSIPAHQWATPDCEKVVSLLDMIIDGEATDDDKTYFFTHVETCKECFSAHEQHNRLKEVLRVSIKRQVVPSNLLASIKSVIKATV